MGGLLIVSVLKPRLPIPGKIIPPSQRPDGTWRKARRVKDGYVPQEEVPLYESKGKLFAQRRPPTGLVGGGGSSSSNSNATQKSSTLMPPTATTHGPGLVIIKPSKPAKAKVAAKQNKSSSSSNTSSNNSANPSQLATQMERLSLSAEEERDPEKLLKHVKKLRKKLREIENINGKIKSGEIKAPDKDQLDKVARKELIRVEVERLEKSPLLAQAEAMQHQKQQQQQASASSTTPTANST